MGSEMCIRDRIDVVTLDRELDVHEAADFERAREQIGLPLDLGDCLLYTSDAADERSSVDLGGRRIIKKKTRDRHERTAYF